MYELLGSKNDCRLEDCESFLQERQVRVLLILRLQLYSSRHSCVDTSLETLRRIPAV